jgi:hypothetical protein
MEQGFAPPADELLRTSEAATFDHLDWTLAQHHPPTASEPVPADGGQNPIASAEGPVREVARGHFSPTSESGPVRVARDHSSPANESGSVGDDEVGDDEEVIIADDLAEMIDAEEGSSPGIEESVSDEPKAKRSVPPPLPRA